MSDLFQNLKRQPSVPHALLYLARYLSRRGPNALRRRWAGRRDAAKFQNQPASTGLRLAFSITGGIGDQIIAARFIRDLQAATQPFAFDIFSPNPAISRWIFSSLPGLGLCSFDAVLDTLPGKYHLTLDISSILRVRSFVTPGAAIGPALRNCINKINAFNHEIRALATIPDRMDGFISQKLQFRNLTRATCLHGISGIPYVGDLYPLRTESDYLSKLGIANKTYITVHNGFEAQHVTSETRATKCYQHFDQVVRLLKRDFPDIQFIQLGSNTSTPIPSVDRNLIGKTNLTQAAAILEEAIAHLDNESGLVHIATCFGTPSCVVFGPTPSDYFAYPGNVSVRPKVCGGCWWITPDWMDRCPRGFAEPICTYLQPPQDVAEAMSAILTRRTAQHDSPAIIEEQPLASLVSGIR
jgi:ADP-heptose:LPS heptosyltransferase